MKAALVILALLLTAGCDAIDEPAADPSAPSTDRSIRVERVRVGESTVPCILWDAPGDGGLAMSCDWTPV